MSESTKPLPSIAEEYRIASHYWQQKWAEKEKEIATLRTERDRYRRALEWIEEHYRLFGTHASIVQMASKADDALKGKG